MKRKQIAAIDIGATTIQTVIADIDTEENLRILGTGAAPSSGVERGMVTEVKSAAHAVSQSVKRAEKMAGCRLKAACIGISGAGTSSQNNCGLISIPGKDEVVHAQDCHRALDIVRDTEMPEDQMILHVIPKSYTLDGQKSIKNPIGMQGFRLNLDAHVVTIPSELISKLRRCMARAGIGIKGIALKSLACAEAVLTEDEKENGVILADIGSATTEIAFFKDGSVQHTVTLPVGGQHITNDIAVGLGVPHDSAEELKMRYGHARADDTGEMPEVVSAGGHSISYQDLQDVITARLEELFRLIALQATEAGSNIRPVGLVITGGSCNLPDITDMGCEITRLPVRIGTPIKISDSAEHLHTPVCAASIGLLHWRISNSRVKSQQGNRMSLDTLIPRWLTNFRPTN